jgi:hypothetical protein
MPKLFADIDFDYDLFKKEISEYENFLNAKVDLSEIWSKT